MSKSVKHAITGIIKSVKNTPPRPVLVLPLRKLANWLNKALPVTELYRWGGFAVSENFAALGCIEEFLRATGLELYGDRCLGAGGTARAA